jgi:hypothetical protein
MWLKLFYFLRLFSTSASLIRLIIQVFCDMFTFGMVLSIAFIGFGNTFYIYAWNFEASVPEDDQANIVEGNFLMALIYSFRLGLGDFNTDNYE